MTEIAYAEVTDPIDGSISERCVRRADGALIPADPANADWQAYLAWRAAGNAPAAPQRLPKPPGEG